MFKKIINSITDKVWATATLATSNSVVVNGKTYHGNSISVNNNGVFIDGELVDQCEDKIVNIEIQGSAETVSTISGDIIVKDYVGGNVSTTSGDINISGAVTGNVTSVSGDIATTSIGGSTSTVSGDIYNYK